MGKEKKGDKSSDGTNTNLTSKHSIEGFKISYLAVSNAVASALCYCGFLTILFENVTYSIYSWIVGTSVDVTTIVFCFICELTYILAGICFDIVYNNSICYRSELRKCLIFEVLALVLGSFSFITHAIVCYLSTTHPDFFGVMFIICFGVVILLSVICIIIFGVAASTQNKNAGYVLVIDVRYIKIQVNSGMRIALLFWVLLTCYVKKMFETTYPNSDSTKSTFYQCCIIFTIIGEILLLISIISGFIHGYLGMNRIHKYKIAVWLDITTGITLLVACLLLILQYVFEMVYSSYGLGAKGNGQRFVRWLSLNKQYNSILGLGCIVWFIISYALLPARSCK